MSNTHKQIAACKVTGATGVTEYASNCTVVRNGAGDYSVTLGQSLDSLEMGVMLTKHTAGRLESVVHTSDLVKQFLFTDTVPAAADCDFTVVFVKTVSGLAT